MPTTVRTAAASLRVLLAQAIDYAGLYPPASLDMRAGVANYERYLNHPQHWALGRFVLAASELPEFLKARQELREREGAAASESWGLSAILSANFSQELAQVAEFNRMAPGAVVDSVEVRVSTPEELELVRKHRPSDTALFFEIAPERTDELLPLISREGGHAKLRTGGVVPEAFPSIAMVAGFLARCAELGLPFKATAGLHHPLRCMAPLTYEEGSARHTMCGFLNLFTAAAIAWHAREAASPAPLAAIPACLSDPERAHWHFGEDGMTWSGDATQARFGLDALVEMRARFALSFGSCSFEEPIDELRGLALL